MKWLLEQRFASVLITLLIVGIGLSIASEFFLMPRNLMNVGRQISVVAIVALGQTLVIMSGGIDLSAGSNIGLSAVCSALVLKLTGSPELAILAALLCGTMVGLANGGLVAIARINPFIATLGMLSVARGAALLLTGGLPQEFRSWASFLATVVRAGKRSQWTGSTNRLAPNVHLAGPFQRSNARDAGRRTRRGRDGVRRAACDDVQCVTGPLIARANVTSPNGACSLSQR